MCFRLYFIYKKPWSNSFRYSNHIQVTFEHFFEGFMYYLITLTSMIPYKHFLFFFKDMAFLWIPPLAENTLYWKWSGCTVYSQVSVAFCHEHREWALGLAFRVSETRIRCSGKGHALCQGARGHAWDFLSGLCSPLWDKQHRTSGCKWFLRNDFWGGGKWGLWTEFDKTSEAESEERRRVIANKRHLAGAEDEDRNGGEERAKQWVMWSNTKALKTLPQYGSSHKSWGRGCMVLLAALLPPGPYLLHKPVFMCCVIAMNSRLLLCVRRGTCGRNPHERLGDCSDKSPGRLNGSDDFHAAIWTVVIWKVNSLLVLIGVASVVCLVRLKLKPGEPTWPPQSSWP